MRELVIRMEIQMYAVPGLSCFAELSLVLGFSAGAEVGSSSCSASIITVPLSTKTSSSSSLSMPDNQIWLRL